MSQFKINSIKDKEGTHGPTIAGVSTNNSTGCMIIPNGNTAKRVTLPQESENIVTDQLFALYDAGHGSLREGTTLRDVSGNGRDLPIATVNDPNSNSNKAVSFDHRNGGGIRLTISKYYLPSGKSISEVGVTPDILVEEIGDDFKIKSEKDNQLNYAIKLFNS